MQEIAVAQVSDLENGQMQQIAVGDSQILLSSINDQFYAASAFCTHYGAPLGKGILCGEKIICPWHNACFNAIAGQQEAPPGLDSLAFYLQNNQIMTVAGVNRDRDLTAISELMRQQKCPIP